MENITLASTLAFILLMIYAFHTYVVISHHFNIIENEVLAQRIESLPAGNGWIFLLVTVGLPLACSICAGWVNSPIIIPENSSAINVLPSFLFNVAVSIFVLMITIEIGYLYDDRTTKWRPYIIGALIIDIIALLCFLTIVSPPEKVVITNAEVNSFFFGLVSLGSMVSSCGTIYLCKLHATVGNP